MESSAWEPDGNQILILPSVLARISNQGINDMMRELEELRSISDQEEFAQDEEQEDRE
jgi:hypothetical protein